MNQDIVKVIEQYFQGSFQGSEQMLRAAFHPEAHIVGMLDGNYIDIDVAAFIARVQGAAQDNVNAKFDKTILEIIAEKNMATVVAKVLVGDTYFIDHLSLLLLDGEWKIRHKAFTNSL